jgi:hypothetical protein
MPRHGTLRAALVVVMVAFVAGGCAPRMITEYAPRKNELVFVVQKGSSYTLGDCKRAADGTLTDCKVYEMEFR